MTVFLGLGTNIDNRESNLRLAVARIEEFIGRVMLFSGVYETEPWGFQSEKEFLNMVVEVETELTPGRLMGELLRIESMLGRVRTGKQYSSRVIDIDILFYGGIVINEADLKIPHPLLHERRFVLVPLCEIAPEMIHPVLNKTVSSLLEACKDTGVVRPYVRFAGF